ncbi:IS1 family transposase [Mucilaginibacter terrae]|uniref:Transposase-like protein n=1 Tax=Mucilaginibacter terrae TaxID=1955052 RepID=A0ABU3GVA8_9SPHI|nr:transposase-like protein [Mucilaginibacter terrae]
MTSCIKPVDAPKCVKCNGVTIRYGKTQGRQRYRCKFCKMTFLQTYSYRAWSPYCSQNIVALLTEGCGIRSIARLLKVATGTVIKRIKQIAGRLHKPSIESGGIYEVDEFKTYIGSKECPCWVILALDRASGKVVEIVVGKRNMANLSSITNVLINTAC